MKIIHLHGIVTKLQIISLKREPQCLKCIYESANLNEKLQKGMEMRLDKHQFPSVHIITYTCREC